ncbi:hypothetical protein L2E82_45104 [Cichorium intybus]|uniref:Uncharacterized protein n=1 Tax=Cichorium intybus TaxID=13427 RepID=A0ACB8ZRZ7_CICIN|nr:hypothetical protein L2E82_45104 [Cichorium intybus]
MVWNWKDRVRSGRESGQLADLKQVIADFRFANGPDSWCWKGGGIDFSVNNLRNLMDASVGGPVTASPRSWESIQVRVRSLSSC